jgi:hypothetical protein
MGTWSGEPFGNDTAADWVWELDDVSDWGIPRDALEAAIGAKEPLDSDAAAIAIAAAEVVAAGLGRATQTDAYTESVQAFVSRSPQPPADLPAVALAALAAATNPSTELYELWNEADPAEWLAANESIKAALTV